MGSSYLPRTEPIEPMDPDSEDEESPMEEKETVEKEKVKPWVPKPDPYAEIQKLAGVPMERGFKSYRRMAVLRPYIHPDPNDLLEAHYFHSPQKFRHTNPS